ncbi:MAG: DNA polymerase/3'-5' exonuclease PolX [Bacteroidetes bacterium]|nr:DNA polymerase/3'-5' exonuclease PolX [Bacteroidota bacterium]
MDNYDISSRLGLYARLAELHDENPFRVKAFAAAAFNLKKIKEPIRNMPAEDLATLPGVGKSVLQSVSDLLSTGSFPALDQAIAKTPEGVMDMLRIKGLGPKKVQAIWRNMGIESVEELFDACRENRLVSQPGFGLKTQAEVMRAIEFSLGARGKFHFSRVEKPAKDLVTSIKREFPHCRVELTGAVRRCCEVIEKIEVLTSLTTDECLQISKGLGLEHTAGGTFTDVNGFIYEILHCTYAEFNTRWFETTATPDHLQELGYKSGMSVSSEAELYQSFNLPFIEPEMREGQGEVQRMKQGLGGKLLEYGDLKGILHNHSTYSDGLHSLEEMARHAQSLGYGYLAICDHSRSAAYANGLQTERLLAQIEEIRTLNQSMAPFRVFAGVESDILQDGSLDYPDEILAQLDLVVASVHSNLKMDKEKATRRLQVAIENPFTTILGHPTGRLLLVREGYPIDHAYIVDCCAANGVSIELNANPFRLDLDWRWITYAMEKGVMVGINPDAHAKEGYHDMYYGTLAARKGGLTREMCLNALPLEEFTNWLQRRRSSHMA